MINKLLIFATYLLLNINNINACYMIIKNGLRTCAKNHAIKEAIITFFVLPKIINPEKYSNLLENGQPLSGLYQKYEPIKQVEIKIGQGASTNIIKEYKNEGFKLISFRDGQTSDVIQGLNQPNRGLFTFNTVNYKKWKEYYENAISAAKHIASVNSNTPYMVTAYNLTFIDEFYYEDKNKYKGIDIFNKNSINLPENILEAKFADYNLNIGKDNNEKPYIENILLRVIDEVDKKTIQITNAITFVIDNNPTVLSSILKDRIFQENLDFAHEENKNMLKDILNTDVCKAIKLIKNDTAPN